jgi:hypothetical protein
VYRIATVDQEEYLSFRYTVQRIWQMPPTDLLRGSLGTLPLAPLGAVRQSALPGLLRTLDRRFTDEAPRPEADRLRIVTYTLLGLHYPRDIADQLMPGIRIMRDSVTYQGIVDEGRVEGRTQEAREVLIEFGTHRLGAPDARTQAELAAIDDHARLRALAARLFDVTTWDEFLASA